MFVIDYLRRALRRDKITVVPFHSGHLGMIPDFTLTSTLLEPHSPTGNREICVTPYEHPLERLFRLKCILKEKSGVVNKLLRAIAAMRINILALESATLESKNGHGVYLLLDWGTSARHAPVPVPPNIASMFFPHLAGIVPSTDLRYVILLRQIIGQCGDVLLWTETTAGNAVPRLTINGFEEDRQAATSAQIEVRRVGRRKRRKLERAGVTFSLPNRIAAATRLATNREPDDPLDYLLLSDIESKTLRILIPRKGRENRMIHVALSHKNKPGALCGITRLIADSELSILSAIVRRRSPDRNALEATIEHNTEDILALYKQDPAQWAETFLARSDSGMRSLLRYYEVYLEPPLFPRRDLFDPLPLFDPSDPVGEDFNVITADEAEGDIRTMKERFQRNEFVNRRWLASLLFDDSWGPKGKPTVFLSFPSSGATQAAMVERYLENAFHVRKLQRADVLYITPGAIERIRSCEFFVGVWHHEEESKSHLSPWMPFEYGVAKGTDKRCSILIFRSLERYGDRIDRDAAKILYDDLVVNPDPLEVLRVHCRSWSDSHLRLTIEE